MSNTIVVRTRDDKRVQTDIVTSDGVSCMEIHRAGLYESRVLTALVERKYYQYHKGQWHISFPDDAWVSTQASFEKAVQAAELHIFERDNSIDYDGFC